MNASYCIHEVVGFIDDNNMTFDGEIEGFAG